MEPKFCVARQHVRHLLGALRWVVLVLWGVACTNTGTPERAGALYLAVQTDLSIPQDIDSLQIDATVAGESRFSKTMELLPEGKQGLPFVAEILSGEAVGAEVVVTVVALRDGEARGFAKAVTTFPETGSPLLELPIQWLCLDQVRVRKGQVESLCPEQRGQEQVCRAGSCENAYVSVETLKPFTDETYAALRAAADAGAGAECFDLAACFEGASAAAPDRNCHIAVDGVTADSLNVAVELAPEEGTGHCDEERCLVPLDYDPQSGWGPEAMDAGALASVALPPAVCERLRSGDASGVSVSTRCDAKRSVHPVCGPWTRISVRIAPEAPLSTVDGGYTDGGLDARARVQDAQVAEAGGPGEQPEIQFAGGETEVSQGDRLQLVIDGVDADDIEWESSDPSVATVDGGGVLTAVADGTVTITARFGDQVVTIEVTVGDGSPATSDPEINVTIRNDLVALRLEPEEAEIPAGYTVQLRAIGTFRDGAAEDVTAAVVWSSSDPEILLVEDNGLVTGNAPGRASVVARYGEDGMAEAAVVVSDAALLAFWLSPEAVTAPVGVPVSLRASASYSDGTERDVTARALWSVDDVAVAAVSAPGSLVGLKTGGTEVSAAFGGQSASAAFTVTNATLSSLDVSPPSVSMAAGGSQQLVAQASYSDGATVVVSGVATWESSDPSVAAVAAGGRLSALAAGAADIAVSFGGMKKTVRVVVTDAVPTRLRVDIGSQTLAAGLERRATATASYSDGSSADVTLDVSWRSADVEVASVDDSGWMRGIAPGNTSIAARLGALEASEALTIVDAPLISIRITPGEVSLPSGVVRQLVATGVFADGSSQEITTRASWASNAVEIASVGALGRVTGVSVGQAEISAAFDGVVGFAQVDVSEATVTSLVVEPEGATLPAGAEQPLIAYVTYSDGATLDMSAEVVWTSSAPQVAQVGSDGVVLAVAPGSAQIRAAFAGEEAVAAVEVTDAVLTELALRPDAIELPVGEVGQFEVLGTYSDGATRVLTDGVAWLSLDQEVVSVSGGVVRAEAVGSGAVRAVVDALEAEGAVTVTNAVATSLVVTPEAASIPLGLDVMLRAEATYSDGSTADVTDVAEWTTLAPAVASVSSSGVVSGITVGEAPVRASFAGLQSEGVVTVSNEVVTEVTVSALDAPIPLGRTEYLIASATYTDGTKREVTADAIWTVAVGDAVTVSKGAVRARAVGKATVVVQFDGFEASTVVEAGNPVVESLTLSPETLSLAAGNQYQLALSANYSDGVTRAVPVASAAWSSDKPAAAKVAAGLVQGVGPGEARVSAAFEGKSTQAVVTVTAAELIGLVMSDESVTTPAGLTRTVSVEGKYSDGVQRPVEGIGWTSDNTTVATVKAGVIAGKAAGKTTVRATKGELTASVAVVVSDALLDSLTLSAPRSDLPAGLSVTLSAKAHYTDGRSEDVKASYASANTKVATVDAAGVVTGKAPGRVIIRGQFQTASAELELVVQDAVLTDLAILPAEITLPAGTTAALEVQATYSDGQTLSVNSGVSWRSASTAVATVSAGGVVTGKSAGTTQLTAGYGGKEASASVTVGAAVIDFITVEPPEYSMPAGYAIQLQVFATYTDSTRRPVNSGIVWSSNAQEVVSVDSTGLAKSRVAGGAAVTAQVGSKSAQSLITVTDAVLQSIVITSNSDSLPAGGKLQLGLDATYSDGRTTAVSGASWKTLTGDTATVSAEGLVGGLKPGEAQIEAQFKGLATTIALKVTDAVPTQVVVEPASVALPVGLSQRVTAFQVLSDGRRLEATDAIWTTQDSKIAVVTGGDIRAVGEGTTTVRAQVGEFAGVVDVSIRKVELTGVSIRPASVTVAVGREAKLEAWGDFTDGSSAPVKATWSATGGSASVDATGVVRGVSVGQADVSAAVGALQGKALVNVTAAVVDSIVINGPSNALPLGLTAQLSVTALYTDGREETPASDTVDWVSLSPDALSVNAKGQVKGLAVIDSGTVQAKFGGATATLGISVSSAVVTSLGIDPLPGPIPAGRLAQLVARARYSDDTTTVVSPTSWTSLAPEIASVDALGRVYGGSVGSATIRAQFQGVSGEVKVAVGSAVLESFRIAAPADSLFVGDALKIRAYGLYSNSDVEVELTSGITWTSSSATVASVSDGTVTGKAAGPVTIQAAIAGLPTQSVALRVVTPVPVSIKITPAEASVAYQGSVGFSALVTLSNGKTSGAVTWSSDDPKIASHQGGGKYVGSGHGATKVIATAGNVSASAALVVTPIPTGIVVSPTSAQIKVGESATFSAQVTMSDGTSQSAPNATWTVAGNDGFVSVVSPGVFTGMAAGSVAVSATAQGQTSDAAILTVVPAKTVQKVAVGLAKDSNAVLRPGEQTILTVTAYWSDDTITTPTTGVTWTHTGTSVAAVRPGRYIGIDVGTSEVTATYEGLKGNTNLDVRPRNGAELGITPDPVMVPQGGAVPLSVVIYYPDGLQYTVTPYADYVVKPQIAKVDAGNVVFGDFGEATIVASFGGVTANGNYVGTRWTELRFEPNEILLRPDQSVQTRVLGVGAGNVKEDVTKSCTFSLLSTQKGVVRDQGGGSFLGTGAGSVVVFCALDGSSASASIRVASPDTVCGNAKVETGETCDDGNTISGDGCSALCLLERGNQIGL